MVNFTNVKLINKKHKKVIATSIFIVQENYLTYKSAQYINGLIKSVETFPERMGKDWIYRIYYDSQFDEYYINKQYIIDTDIYKPNDKDNEYDKILKRETNKSKDIIKYIMDMVSVYLNKIKNYSYIELIKYDYKPFHKNGYIGHPYTFGSFIRFFAMFDEDVDIAYSVNSSDAISKTFASNIKKWEKTQKSMCTFYIAYNSIGYDKYIFSALIKFLEKHKIYPNTLQKLKSCNQKLLYDLYRWHAISGFRCKDNKLYFNQKILDLNKSKQYLLEFIDTNNNTTPEAFQHLWKYGIDEILLCTLVIPLIDLIPEDYKLSNDIYFVSYEVPIYDILGSKSDIISNIFSNILNINNKLLNKQRKHYDDILSGLKLDGRTRKLVGQKLLQKIYNKPIDKIKIDIDCHILGTWKILSVFDEYKPKLFVVDYDKNKVNQILKLKAYLDITIFTTNDIKNNTKNNIYKKIEYNDRNQVIKDINNLIDNLIDYYKSQKKYIDIINYLPKKINSDTIKSNQKGFNEIKKYKYNVYENCINNRKKKHIKTRSSKKNHNTTKKHINNKTGKTKKYKSKHNTKNESSNKNKI
jgi:hypothetical protein